MIGRPAYCTREQVKRALDIKETARNNDKVDRAITAAADNIDGILHRRFYIADEVMYYDWPSYQYAYPWRIWFDEAELADVTVNVPVVTTGGVVIPAGDIFWGPSNYAPPYTYLELNRSTSAAFGAGPTPQRDVAISGTRGYSRELDTIGTLAATAMAGDATVVVSDGSQAGCGNMLFLDSERMLVTNITSADTGQTLTSGCETDSAADDTMIIPSGPAVNPDEILLINSERMLVIDVTGNSVIVKRAWDGTILAAHSPGAEIYAYRTLAVNRGGYGTTAAGHTMGVTASVLRTPSLIRDLAIAESEVQVLQEIGGYSDMADAIGGGLADKWDEAETRYGRKARIRVI